MDTLPGVSDQRSETERDEATLGQTDAVPGIPYPERSLSCHQQDLVTPKRKLRTNLWNRCLRDVVTAQEQDVRQCFRV